MTNPYWRLMRADRPIGTLLLAWPMLAALLIAGAGNPPVKVVVLFLIGAFVMRSAGCVINDYADRDIDGHVSRTQQRPLATGEVKAWQALVLFAGLLIIALLIVLQFNKATVLLSIAAAGVATLYPFCKRFTQLPQVVLGIAFSFGILMPFTALEQGLPLVAWVLFAANICWTVAYDTEYAMADRADDVKIGVKSTAILFGGFDKLAIALLQLATLGLMFWLGWLLNFGWLYWLGLIIITLLFAWQQVMIFYREPQRCFQAFLHNNHVGWVLAAAIAASYWY
ncbi:4-hydroxybenzoate octaprenyltransferase [Pseudidiomarina piscicola]|uniref:4-hydroxybenzoate octaprenyltransferase n=1 Tax=Pseudidiomarina piscicola TaxID=2614830 RepID=A0A6S6WU56_9GAMM|nr:4-hydroxybenzoate octaprenyltransferase [Pseudidiomarina piscicola]CAB0150642.1 4-hydroxybenzoate octaprenyltransferase [Pseudidiomarina piscicola]VZT40145.1 4-hydroxybenzoate octaprenyltransferase [Pseudomonas aeruginosa]